MMMCKPTQYDFEFPFGPPATEVKHGKSRGTETMPKKSATLDAHFCQLNFSEQARATPQICPWLWLVLSDALAAATTNRKSTNS
jgi:hypothetical protein